MLYILFIFKFNSSLIEYRNTINFFILTGCSVTFVELTNSRSNFVDSLGFSITNRDNVIFSAFYILERK